MSLLLSRNKLVGPELLRCRDGSLEESRPWTWEVWFALGQVSSESVQTSVQLWGLQVSVGALSGSSL